jgi:protein-histidine pros-kinase
VADAVPDQAWQDVLDSAPDAMLLVGPNGRIGMVNRQLEAMFGYARGELVGKKVEVLVPDGVREAHRGHRRGFMDDPKLRPMGHGLQLQGRRRDGTALDVEVSLSPIEREVGTIVSVAVRDVTHRRLAEDQFRALLDTAPDAMVIVGADGRIRLVNRQLESMFRYSRGELVGQPVEVLVPAGLREVHRRHREGYARSPRVRQMGHGLSLHGRRSDGTELPVEISLSPLETPDGRLVSAAIRDATDRVETERRLRELDVLKDEFLSVVSHELRTPLTAISGFAQLLLARPDAIDEESRADMLARIARNAAEMDRLVGQLLDLSRLDAGQVELHPASLPLAQAVETCVRSLATDVAARVTSDVPPDLVVVGDAHALDRVLSNLVTNAAKFSPDDRPVHVGAAIDDDGRGVVVTVTDQGPGIPESEREKVFERFYQLGTDERRPRHGTGIGLSIVRRYVELLGGRVWVDAPPGDRGGSAFSFTLPRA